MAKKKQKSQARDEFKSQDKHEIKDTVKKPTAKHKTLDKLSGNQPVTDSSIPPAKSKHNTANAMKIRPSHNGPNKQDTTSKGTPRKGTVNDRDPNAAKSKHDLKAGKRKHDLFFAPPEPTNALEHMEEKAQPKAQLKPAEPSNTESQAVIETIKIPSAVPESESGAASQSGLASRSGVVSVLDKTNKKRKRSNIDVVAELEKDAKKVVRTGTSLGAGLEVDGWD